jgi:hypothetical protein
MEFKVKLEKNNKLRGLTQRANYNEQANAAFYRS